ncbi:30S ribosomal protein S5 alanine N-acetyltransferase, partial [Parabacteroides distasonis]|nr:30S ribosomal protein S5 alanine N-acetyltransferase [Parabacteroides distasonis]
MEDLSTPERIYKHDGNLILRTAQIDDANMISEYFQTNREHLKP